MLTLLELSSTYLGTYPLLQRHYLETITRCTQEVSQQILAPIILYFELAMIGLRRCNDNPNSVWLVQCFENWPLFYYDVRIKPLNSGTICGCHLKRVCATCGRELPAAHNYATAPHSFEEISPNSDDSHGEYQS